MKRKSNQQQWAKYRPEKSWRDPSKPLRHSRQESFAQTFARSLNAKYALLQAGYPSSAWQRLTFRFLSIEAMQKRIGHLQREDAESLNPVVLIQRLFLDQRALMAKAFVRNPFTGTTTYDLRRLTPKEAASLEFTLSGRNGQLGPTASVILRSGNLAALSTLWKIVSDANFAPDRKGETQMDDLLGRALSSARPFTVGTKISDKTPKG